MKTESESAQKVPPPPKLFRPKTGYGPVAAVTVMLLTYFLSQIFAAIFVGFGAGLFGYDPESVLVNLGDSALTQFIYIVIVQAVTLYAIWAFLKIRAVPWKDIGLGRKLIFKDFSSAVMVFVIYFGVLVVLTAILSELIPGLDTEQKQQLGFENVTLPSELLLVFISLVILPPIVEEIMVRGFLYTGLRAKYTKVWSAIIASFIFGIAHLQLGSGAAPLWIAAVDTAVLSLFLVYLRERTGALWSGMIVHGLKNGLAFIALFVIKL